jgi:hypothetical protein
VTEQSRNAERRLGWPLVLAWLAVLLCLYVWGLRDYAFHREGVQSTGSLVFMFFILAGLCYLVALVFTLVLQRRRPRALGVLAVITPITLVLAWFPTPRHQAHGTAQLHNFFASGNLEVTHAIGCIPLSQANSEYSPPDLYHGVAACLDSDDVPAAVQLHQLGAAYGTFDARRVSDQTAHQALLALWAPITRNASDSQRAAWKKEAIRVRQDPAARAAMCDNLRRIGPPAYYPRYMIQHGMGAFTGNQGKPAIVANFDANQTWKRILTDPLLCGTAADVGEPH